MKPTTLGILGGLGPMSGVYFCEMLLSHTKAERDQDHLNFLLSSRADTPDRTAYITGESREDPTPVMIREVRRLSEAGADLIAIPCNTAHYFYDAVAKASSVPILNIIESTAAYCAARGFSKVGVMATAGTVSSGSYKNALDKHGIECITPSPEDQRLVGEIIYGDVKQGKDPDSHCFLRIANVLRQQGAETVILGCTELSLLKRTFRLGEDFTDSLEVLALSALRLCGKTPIGFEAPLMAFLPPAPIHS